MLNPWKNSEDFSHIDRAGNDPFAPREPVTNPAGGIGRIHTPVLRTSVYGDGTVVMSEDGPLRTSVDQVAAAADAAASVPYEYCLDPVYRNRVAPSEVTDACIVKINGAEMTVKQARQIGYMAPAEKSAVPFDKASPSEDNQEATDDAEQETAELSIEAFADPAVDEAFSGIINATAPHQQLAAVNEIVSEGAVGEQTLNALAAQMGVTPSELQSKFEPVMAHYEAQGRAAVEKALPGVQSEAVFEWAREHAPDVLKKVMHVHATERRTYGYQALAQAWLEQLADTDPDSALASNLPEGWSSSKDDKGRVIVTSPQGKTMSWRGAMETRRPA